jgi:hypothetical protein
VRLLLPTIINIGKRMFAGIGASYDQWRRNISQSRFAAQPANVFRPGCPLAGRGRSGNTGSPFATNSQRRRRALRPRTVCFRSIVLAERTFRPAFVARRIVLFDTIRQTSNTPGLVFVTLMHASKEIPQGMVQISVVVVRIDVASSLRNFRKCPSPSSTSPEDHDSVYPID